MGFPTDDELRRGRLPSEDSFVERKTASDAGDWLKTIVAFANSVPIGRFGVLYIGVRDSGQVEGTANLDTLQKTVEKLTKSVSPRLSPEPTMRVLSDDGRDYLCVIVPGSERRPHFSGPAYVRIGSQTFAATDEQHERLIADHNSKTRRILQFRGKPVSIEKVRSGDAALKLGRVSARPVMVIVDCTAFTLTLKDQYGNLHPIALDRIAVLDQTGGIDMIAIEVRED